MRRFGLIILLIVGVMVGLRVTRGNSDTGTADGISAAGIGGELVTLISKGETVAITDHVPDKGVVIVEFMADW